MVFKKFEDMTVWKTGRELVKKVYAQSAAEAQSQLYHAVDLGYVDQSTFDSLYDELNKIQVMIYRLIQSLSLDPCRQKV